MARLFTTGAELGHIQAEGLTATGANATFATDRARTGSRSLKVLPTSASTWFGRTLTWVNARDYWVRAYFQTDTIGPAGNPALILGTVAGSWAELRLEPNGAGAIRFATAGGHSNLSAAGVISADTWHRIEVRFHYDTTAGVQASEGYEVLVDGVSVLSGNIDMGGSLPTAVFFGQDSGTAAVAGTGPFWYDDIAINDDQGADQNSWPGAGEVRYLRPVAALANGEGANWVKPGGSSTDRHTSLDNAPPVFETYDSSAASAEDYLHNVTGGTNVQQNISLEVEDYTTAGLGASDVVSLVQLVMITGSSSGTDTAGELTGVSNPAITLFSFAAFDNGVASATPTTWPRQASTVVYSPTVTKGDRPVVLVRKATSTTRVALINALALIVESVPSNTTAVGASLAMPYTVRAAVGSSRSLPYTLRAPVGTSLAQPFTVKVAAGRSLSTPYTVRAPVGSSRAFPYTVSALAGRSLAQPYTVRANVGRSLVLPFDVRALAGRSLALPYLLRAAVGRSLALPYDVAEASGEGRYIEVSWVELEVPAAVGVTAVGRSLVMPYTVKARAGNSLEQPYTVKAAVGSSVATPYIVRATVGQSLAQPFTIHQLAGRSVALPYLVRVAAGRSLDLPYLLRAAVGRSLVLPYEVAGPLGVVGRSLVLPYTVRQLAGRSLSQPYSITILAGRSLALPYSIRATAGRSLATPYLLRGRAARSLAMPYTVRQLAGQSVALPYSIRVTAGRSLATPYLLRARAGRSLAMPFGVAGRVGSSLAMSYIVRARVGRSLVLPYTLTFEVGRSLAMPYKISATAGRSLQLRYSIVGRAGASLAMPYTVRRVAGRSLAMPYSFGNLAGASLVMSYTIHAWLPQPHEAFPVFRSAQAVAVVRVSTAHSYRNADAAAILPDEEAEPIRDEALVESL